MENSSFYMKKNYKTRLLTGFIFLIAGLTFLQSCSNDAEKKPEEKQQYVLSDSLFKTLTIDTAKECQLVNAVTLTGQVDFNQDNVIKIYPLISGNIEGINVVLGDYVHEGQVLGTIKSSEMAGYSNDVTNAETNLNLAEKNLEKTKDMYKSGLASVTDSISAEVAYQQAKSGLERVNRVLKLNGGSTTGEYVIKAPISGFIVEKNVNNNSNIRTDNGGSLFTISDLKNVWVWANVYESNIGEIHMGSNVDVTTISYPDKVFTGKIDKIMNVLDPTNKVMKVRVSLDNSDYLLKPQMFASVTVTNKEDKQALCISHGALIFDHSQYFVLVYKSNSDIEIKPVNVINTIDDKTYISSGLQEGDKVISSQAILIYDALNS
jgi:cobalt-zinc-cadmium efflux system membrane fusion protein